MRAATRSIPNKSPPRIGKRLDSALNALFGSPANPKVELNDSELKQQISELELDVKTLKDGSKVDTLKEGSKHYRRHCMHCHGVTGDGRGPTGPWVNPHPRDYRQGLFKFISSDVGRAQTTTRGHSPHPRTWHRRHVHALLRLA